MLFNSINFIVFLSIFIPLYFLAKGRVRKWLTLSASYLFYGWWDYRFLLLIAILTLINFYCGLNITTKNSNKQKILLLSFSVISSLLILGFFKYYNFFLDNIIGFLNFIGFNGNFNTLHIILPVGISFYTFQAMSYPLDVYSKKIMPEKSLLNFATFVAFFPQLVAGPIVRASCFIPQLKTDRTFNSEDILNGINLIIWGFFLKIVIADSLALVVDVRFENPEIHNALSLLIGIIFYAFQIYGDFAGYSLIAIGVARILGYKFPANFDRPYFSSNLGEFWHRWHISLSSWLRDYLYIPLGGNRVSELKIYRNILITMLLGGLWHGANWNFIIWGGIHGIVLVVQRVYLYSIIPTVDMFKPVKILFTFSIVCLAWVFFRSNSLNDSLYILEKIFQFQDYNFSGVTQKFHVIKGSMLICFLVLTEGISFGMDTVKFKNEHVYLTILWSACILTLISLFGTFGSNSFIYFQF